MSTEKKTDYRYYIKPTRDNTNEQIAARLDALGDSAFSNEHQSIVVDGVRVLGVYEVPHSMLTEISHTEHHQHVHYYVQEGKGKIRTYILFRQRLRTLSRTKAVKTVAKVIRKMK